MKNINYIINGVLAVAIIVLFIMQFTGKKETKETRALVASEEGEVISSQLPVAYVDMDSLLLKYNYYKDLTEQLMRKEENSLATINQRMNELQSEAQDFQRKIENNAFLTRERAMQEEQRLMNKRQELENLNERLSNELYIEREKLNLQLRDSLIAQLKIFNQSRGYQIIFGNVGNNILLANETAYNITDEVVDHLNRNYSSTNNK